MCGLYVSDTVVFENFYSFNKVGCKKPYTNHNFVITHIYSFKTNRARYIAEIEEYKHLIYIIKFYRKCDIHNAHKYNILTHEYNCTQIVSTCIRILVEILNKNPAASFGFLGSNTINNGREELKQKTKRFNIYKTAMENLIGDKVFVHSMDEVHSTYLMANRKNEPIEGFLLTAQNMFEEIYPELEN